MMYEEIIDSLDGIGQFASSTGVQRASRLLKDMGNPEEKLKIIHVAGTNGKGSVCAYIAQILKENGYKTGLFTSPHLVDIRERIRIDDEMISKEDFVKAYEYVEQHAGGKLAYFDYLFGMAIYYYSRQSVDYVVMETGLGGRLDATNAVRHPLISVITTISLEHTAILGDTIEKIAAEKAGIIKPGIPVVCSGMDRKAAEVIKEAADSKGSQCIAVDENTYELKQNTFGYIDFLIHNEYYKNDCFKLATNALYQMENASIALTACAVLKNSGVRLDDRITGAAVSRTHWAGRMEPVRDNFFVDGAHNPQGIKSFVESVDSLYANEHLQAATLLFSVVSDKNYDQMIKTLCGCKHFKCVYVTMTGGVRKLSPGIIKDTFETYLPGISIEIYDSVDRAIQEWDGGLMFAAGSLYLVGDVVRALERKENNHD